MTYLNDRVEWIAVDTIIKGGWGSIDSFVIGERPAKKLTLKEWRSLLRYKRKDECYEYSYNKLKTEGFRMALCYSIGEYDGEEIFLHENGHHRLAAAIALGYKYIPYIRGNYFANFNGEELIYPQQPN
jgi:hypothetical protein